MIKRSAYAEYFVRQVLLKKNKTHLLIFNYDNP